ncbi:hypothetical protein G6F64_015289 [Rhizopus arrhizus]|uniref:DUF4148 domain-containing protein n=1 Tax=Rhizopus oryzae TaxID=64495 RepID=A0A9P7BHG9_RHIOR|nr:hypothetical protein G6F64_015289 [Rhizopus arrhizus]
MVTFGELDYPPNVPASTDKSREAVQAEMREARARGVMKSGELDYPPVTSDLSANPGLRRCVAPTRRRTGAARPG